MAGTLEIDSVDAHFFLCFNMASMIGNGGEGTGPLRLSFVNSLIPSSTSGPSTDVEVDDPLGKELNVELKLEQEVEEDDIVRFWG